MRSDIAIDLGTSRIRIFAQNKGLIIDEPSVITVDLETDAIIAVGQQAYEMVGKTSDRLLAAFPLSGGVITDFGLVEAMISTMLRNVVSSGIGMPRAVACVPGEITEVEKRAVVNAISSSGIRKVCLIEEPVAAAIGAGVDIENAHGTFVADLGAGTCDMAVITLGGVAVSRSIKLAGNNMDENIMKYIKKEYNMLVGKNTAEKAKINTGCVIKGSRNSTYRVKGRNLVTGLPSWVDLHSEETIEPLLEIAEAIVHAVQDVLEETPPELTGDIYSDGMILTGGTAQIPGLAQLISNATKLKVRVAEDPAGCVVRGCGAALKYIDINSKNPNTVNPITDRY